MTNTLFQKRAVFLNIIRQTDLERMYEFGLCQLLQMYCESMSKCLARFQPLACRAFYHIRKVSLISVDNCQISCAFKQLFP